jgi:hypothetical protein
MPNLFKFIAKIRRHYTKRPTGLWMPPPDDCTLMVYHFELKCDIQSVAVFHDPFICNGKCPHGWKYGIVERESNKIY